MLNDCAPIASLRRLTAIWKKWLSRIDAYLCASAVSFSFRVFLVTNFSSKRIRCILSCYILNKGTIEGRRETSARWKGISDHDGPFNMIATPISSSSSLTKILIWKASALYSILLYPYYISESDIYAQKYTLRLSHSKQFQHENVATK